MSVVSGNAQYFSIYELVCSLAIMISVFHLNCVYIWTLPSKPLKVNNNKNRFLRLSGASHSLDASPGMSVLVNLLWKPSLSVCQIAQDILTNIVTVQKACYGGEDANESARAYFILT